MTSQLPSTSFLSSPAASAGMRSAVVVAGGLWRCRWVWRRRADGVYTWSRYTQSPASIHIYTRECIKYPPSIQTVYHRDGGSASTLLSNHLPRSNDFRLGFSFEIKPLHQTLVPQSTILVVRLSSDSGSPCTVNAHDEIEHSGRYTP
jgi:hypothetical protein